MKYNFKIITLCGSTKFKDEFMAVQKRLTLEGVIVLSVGVFGHSDNEVWSEDMKIMLDKMHKVKIDMADEIFVVNVGGYIGSSTRGEIDHAIQTGKSVKYLVCPDCGDTGRCEPRTLSDPDGQECKCPNKYYKPV